MAKKRSSLEQDIVTLTSMLMRFRSVKDNPSELKKIIDFVSGFFKGDGLVIKRFVKNNKHSVVILPKGVRKPKLFFLCHADVVEADSKDFIPKIKGGNLFGRGSADMKSGLAIAMLLLKKHKHKPIGLMVTTDEEIGGADGAGLLSKKYSADFIIATECSDLRIVNKEKGVFWVKLIATGKSCHSSRPWDGMNAADLLIESYSHIRKVLPQLKKEAWKTTMNLGLFNAGKAPNIVPGEAEMVLDIRYTEDYNTKRLERIIKGAVGKNIKVEVLSRVPLLNNKKNDINIASLGKSIARVLKKKPELVGEHGASDARFFAGKAACVMFGPYGYSLHGKDEHVNIKSCRKCYAVLEKMVERLSKH